LAQTGLKGAFNQSSALYAMIWTCFLIRRFCSSTHFSVPFNSSTHFCVSIYFSFL